MTVQSLIVTVKVPEVLEVPVPDQEVLEVLHHPLVIIPLFPPMSTAALHKPSTALWDRYVIRGFWCY